MKLTRDMLDMIATARIFAGADLLGDGPDPDAPADCGCGGADHDDCALANSFTVVHDMTPAGVDGTALEAPGVVGTAAPVDVDGMLLVTTIIGASQVLISALLEIIDSDDEAALAMVKDTLTGDPAAPAVELDETLFAAWADTKDMAKHWTEQARLRELEVRRDMGQAMTATVNGQPAIERVKRTEQVRAHPRNVDYLKLVRWDGGSPA